MPDITWFEVTTALAFLYFAQQNVDIAVIEVGLGGRLDATNVVTPVVSIITSLSYDHTHLLGDSLASIAREKGGIIKPGVPVVSAPQPSEALDVLSRDRAGASRAADVGWTRLALYTRIQHVERNPVQGCARRSAAGILLHGAAWRTPGAQCNRSTGGAALCP